MGSCFCTDVIKRILLNWNRTYNVNFLLHQNTKYHIIVFIHFHQNKDQIKYIIKSLLHKKLDILTFMSRINFVGS